MTNRGNLSSTLLRQSRLATVVAVSGIAFPAIAFAQIDNTASVTASTPDGGTVSANSSETVNVEAVNATFTVAKSIPTISDADGADVANPDGGDTITVQYTLDNTGNVTLDASTVSFTDQNPTFNSQAAANSIGTPSFVSGDTDGDGNIDPDETWIYQATYTLAQTDVDNAAGVADGVQSVLTTASIDATGGNGAATFDSGNSTLTANATIVENGSVLLAKIATRDGTTEDDGSVTPYAAGESIQYLLTVTNNGNVTLSSMTVTETAFTNTSGDTLTFPSITCTISSDATIASLAPGASETCTATYSILETDL